MHNFLAEVTADCTDVLVVKPQKVMPNPGRKNQIVHSFEDGRNSVVAVSNTSIFDVELQWTYVSEEDRSTIFELFHDSAKANGSARSFYWYNPVDERVYVVRFLTPLRTVYKPGLLQSIETIRMRVEGIFGDHEYIVDLGDIHLAAIDDGAMFFHDTEDFSAYAGASGNTPFKIVFTDSDGLTAEAWCGEVGGGEVLGEDLTPLDGTWRVDRSVSYVGGVYTFEYDGGYATILDKHNVFTSGALIKADIDVGVTSGYLSRIDIGAYNTLNITANQNYLNYSTSSGSQDTDLNFVADVFFGTIQVNYIKQLTDIPATGLKLYSTQNGTTQSMGTTEAGFNPNTITKVDIYG